MNNDEFLQDFIDEAKAHIDEIEAAYLDKQKLVSDKEELNKVFRGVHSIKGTAGFFALKNIVALSHGMENVLGKLRTDTSLITENILDTLLICNDKLKYMVQNVEQSESIDISHELGLLESAFDAKISADSPKKQPTDAKTEFFVPAYDLEHFDFNKDIKSKGQIPYVIAFDCTKALFDKAKNLIQEIASVGKIIQICANKEKYFSKEEYLEELKNYDELTHTQILFSTVLEKDLVCEAFEIPAHLVMQVQVEKPPAPKKEEDVRIQKTDTHKKTVARESIRVNVDALEKLMALSSEMVLARNRLLNCAKNIKDDANFTLALKNIDVLTSKMQESIMFTRLQPLNNVFGKFPRIIRDIAKNLHKEINLTIKGESTELDKTVIEALFDPLTHIIRNSADHGIETPEQRIAAGKNPVGNVKINAYRKGSMAVIEVSDDGRGIDAKIVKQKALEKGIISEKQAENLTESEAIRLIFAPGFSTAKELSDISGRGVGLDVVKTNIEKLGGYTEITTKKGEGTCLTLYLPPNLAIVNSLTVQAASQSFVIPQPNISHVINIKDNKKLLTTINSSPAINVRGVLIPVIHLHKVLGLKESPCNKAIIMEVASKRFALLVQEVHDMQEILVMPLPSHLKECICYSGAAIMGDGKLSLILDAEGILQLSNVGAFEEDTHSISEEDIKNIMLEYQNMILFKCSGDETYAIDMNMVSRIEKIKTTDIEHIGNNTYVALKEKSMRVIRIEDYLPVTKKEYTQKELYVLVPTLISNPMGILFEQITDNIKAYFDVDTEMIKAKGIFGTCVHKEKILLMLNLYELFELADPKNHPLSCTVAKISKKVLLVEDTPFFQNMERRYLENAGCHVTLAQNGKEALEMLKNSKFDLIISDIIMPVMNGLELIKNIRKNKKYAHLPAIAVSSMTDDSYISKAFENGFNAYECKLNKETLLNAVQNVLRKENK